MPDSGCWICRDIQQGRYILSQGDRPHAVLLGHRDQSGQLFSIAATPREHVDEADFTDEQKLEMAELADLARSLLQASGRPGEIHVWPEALGSHRDAPRHFRLMGWKSTDQERRRWAASGNSL